MTSRGATMKQFDNPGRTLLGLNLTTAAFTCVSTAAVATPVADSDIPVAGA